MACVKNVLTREFRGVVVRGGGSGQGKGGDVHAEGMAHDNLHGKVVSKHVSSSGAGKTCFGDGGKLGTRNRVKNAKTRKNAIAGKSIHKLGIKMLRESLGHVRKRIREEGVVAVEG